MASVGGRIGTESLVATGRLSEFRCAFGCIEDGPDGIALSEECARILGVEEGATVSHVARL